MIRTNAQLYLGCALLTAFACISIASAQTTTPSVSSSLASTSPLSLPQTTVPEQSEGNKPLSALLQNRVINLAANISNRTEATIIRFELIVIRIESRLRKMESEGYATTDAHFYLGEAKKSLEGVKLSVADIDAKVIAFSTSENYWMQWLNVRDTFRDIKTQLQKTKELLTETIVDMKLRTLEGPVAEATNDVETENEATQSEAQ